MGNKKVNRKNHRLNPILSIKDRDILIFLWRHRISTFAALKYIFYPGVAGDKVYFQLLRLRRGEFVKVEKIDGTKNFVWCLGARGFRYLLANYLPELKTKMYRPQSPFHDLIVAGALLGDWGLEPPSNVDIITEQEISSIEIASLPYDLRKKMEHKPDGLWLIPSGQQNRAVALEVEISAKSAERYEQICAFYSSQIFFEYIVWVVESKALGKKILDCSRRHGMPREGIHLFIEKKDFVISGWDCKILNESMNGLSLADFLMRFAGVQVRESSKKRLNVGSTLTQAGIKNQSPSPFLNFALTPTIFNTLRKNPAAPNS